MSFLTFDESTHTYRFNGKDVMTTKHTPGKWKVEIGRNKETAITSDDDWIAVLNRLERTQANARRIVACVNACKGVSTEALKDIAKASPGLIATAPELLETLQKAREDINWMMNNRQFLNDFVFEYIDDAIAKATGETS